MGYNWQYVKTKGGAVTFALCDGDKMVREFDSICYANIFEKEQDFTIKNSTEDFLRESKLFIEAKMRGEFYEKRTVFVDSSVFRALQRKLNKGK